jgi:hypothetical protein
VVLVEGVGFVGFGCVVIVEMLIPFSGFLQDERYGSDIRT